MKTAFYFCIVIFVFVSSSFGQDSYGNLYNVQYISTLSARTFLINIAGQHPLIGDKIEVLIKGLDVPDSKGVCEKERIRAGQAIQLVDFLLSRAKNITLKNVERGRRFRLVATVLVDGKDIREVLVKKGLAVSIKKSQPAFDWCR